MYLKHILLISLLLLFSCAESPAQPDRRTPPGGGNGRPPGGMRGGRDNSSRTPEGAYYKLSDGSSKVFDTETFATDNSDYNVVQITNGTLTLNDGTVIKKGDSKAGNGDATSFYGTNSAVYASGTGSRIVMTGGTIDTDAQGSNAVFSTNGATIDVTGVKIRCHKTVSRGMHATFGGIINAKDVDIVTDKATSSAIATDRGGGFVTVTGGTATAKGDHCAVLYSTGVITANKLTGLAEQGEIAIVEGDNEVIINDCDMTAGSDKRAMMMLQSGSGDADGVNAKITVNNSRLTVQGTSTPLLEVPTLNRGTLTLTDVTLDVPSGVLMLVDYNTQWRTYGGIGNLILNTTKQSWEYTGSVAADSYSTANVTIGDNVIWKGANDSAKTAKNTSVTIEKGGKWILTADSYVTTLNNNGTIDRNGHSLTYTTMNGDGVVQH
jgi:hypothetical protein